MEIYYDYEAILSKAEEIRNTAPKLLEAGDWDGIRELLTISEEYWRGPAANNYRGLVEISIENKSDRAANAVSVIPRTLELSVEQMKARDHEAAEAVRRHFGV